MADRRSRALIPRWSSCGGNSRLIDASSVLGAVLLVSLLAQVAIPMPGTPVPVTGQTFGVTLCALLLGGSRASAMMVVYLAAGLSGAPVLAGAGLGPTFGYLIGMTVAAGTMGVFADRGATGSFAKSLVAATLGTLLIFAFGVAGLALFLPVDDLWSAGVLPFVPGAIVKLVAAAAIARWLAQLALPGVPRRRCGRPVGS